ncbi:MAG TPA: hypothetical protein VIY51_20235 [Xanthobacteraceae bacterium]
MREKMRAAGLILAVLLLLGVALRPGGQRLPLDPDQPIAADGSPTAGQARTIFDTQPLLGAFGGPPRPDLDDPKELQARADIDQRWVDNARDAIGPWIYRKDWRLCEDGDRVDLINAVRLYYDTRGRQKASFALAGPGGKAFIEMSWATPLDRDIDAMVRHLAATGFLDTHYVPAQSYPEFYKVIAHTELIGVECAPLKLINR